MAAKITDPNSFLTSLVSKRGKSELFGVYLTGVTVLADATEDYGYEVSVPGIERDIRNLFARDENDWNRLLVETRMNKDELIFPISFHRGVEPVTVYFAAEGTEMSCMVFIPTLLVSEFVTEFTFYKSYLKKKYNSNYRGITYDTKYVHNLLKYYRRKACLHVVYYIDS